LADNTDVYTLHEPTFQWGHHNMTTKRQVLELLNKSDIVETMKAFGYTGMGVVSKADLLNQLVRARSVKLEEILELFKIYQLRSICDALGFNMGGNRKADLIDRILGRAAKKPPRKKKAKAKAARKSRSGKVTKKAATDTTIVPPEPPVRTVATPLPTREREPHMITGTLKSQIDKIWDAFWSGGISNPMEVIEQMTYLLFIKRLDELHTTREKKANRLKRPIENPVFPEGKNPESKKGRLYEVLRWSRFRDLGDPNEMYEIISEEVFPFIKGLNGENSTYAAHMKDARFTIPTPALLAKVVDMIAAVPMEDRDTKGDLYEYMLGKIATAGQNGQFRTPRHIIQMMVDLTGPKPSDIICDPACGTAGFLIAAAEYLRENHSEIFTDVKAMKKFNHETFNGFDFDSTMLRIGSMNMLLHGIENPDIQNRDSLSEDYAWLEDQYTLILANPPFKGSLDYESCSKELLKVVKTKKTELLFVALFMRLLKAGGRAAVIVPDGVLFGSTKAHKGLRKMLVEDQKLDAIISMPQGVFRPYAGVSTAVMVLTKTNSGGTDNVWFYDMQADGYSLDDKRIPLDTNNHETNNLPDIVNRWGNLKAEVSRKRTEQSFMVPKAEIKTNEYDLSINRYQEIVYEEVQYDPPQKILADLKAMEAEIQSGLEKLEGMLK